MPTNLTFYTNPMSRGRIARWMLEEVGVEYQTEVVDYGPPMKSPDYLKINPMGKVPAIVHGAKVVTECAAICAYLADAFPDKQLAPPPSERADYYRWLFYFAGPVEAAVMNRALKLEIPAEKGVMIGYGNFQQVMDCMEGALSANPYICGEQFTAADVYCGSHIGWGLQFGTIEKRQVFADYWQRVSDREAYRKGNALDEAIMPPKKD